jgi:hypothetical protein
MNAWAAAHPDTLLAELRTGRDLETVHRALVGGAWPGRAEALRRVAHALGRRVPESEYRLPEEGLEALLTRARAAVGARVPRTRGGARHKGRVGDGVELMLVGTKVPGRRSDHPAAEIKSVPVCGDRILERVKLGVLSARSNPLEKCARVLFVFVEERGDHHFVRGYHLKEFARADFAAMWEDGSLVETAAGTSGERTRGLYLTPRWFRRAGLWP